MRLLVLLGLLLGLLESSVVCAQAPFVQYREASGEVTGLSPRAPVPLPGYAVLIAPALPTLEGCGTVQSPRALVVVEGVVTLRPAAACYEGVLVLSREDVQAVVVEALDRAKETFEAAQPLESKFREVQQTCPGSDSSPACDAYRTRALALRSSARALIQEKGW